MAKQRYISTSFWDDEWIQELDPSEKFLYLYLMTNPLTSIAGVYKITIRRMSFDTGFNSDIVHKILARFEQDKKAFFREGYIVLPNWTKHQKLQFNKDKKPNNVILGINRILSELDPEFLLEIEALGYSYKYLEQVKKQLGLQDSSKSDTSPSESIEDPCKPLTSPLNYSYSYSYLDSDLDLDLRKSGNSDESTTIPAKLPDKQPDKESKPPEQPVPAKKPEPQEPTESFKQAGRLACLLEDLHKTEDPKYRGKPDQWAKDIEKLIRIDKRDPREIEKVLRWAKTPGGFWFPNILSGKKLREKFSTLKVQMDRDGPAKKRYMSTEAQSVNIKDYKILRANLDEDQTLSK